jgi:polynucleotide 5'-hydroxyl-kinase GRC3/NOL9
LGVGGGFVGFYLAFGPLSLNVVEGVVEVLGFPVRAGSSVVVPLGRSVSVKVLGSFSVSDWSRLRPFDGSVYASMDSIAEGLSVYRSVVLIGPTDSGKSTLASWVANKVALRGAVAYYLTTDVGQNEVFCPAFVSLARARPPVIPGYSESFTDVKPCFVGSFTPSDSVDRYVECAVELARMADGPLVVDTDGWVSREGVRVKARIAEEIGADVIVAVGLDDVVVEQLRSARGAEVVKLTRLVEGRVKTVEERRIHRERLLTLRLLGARQVKVRVDDVEVDGTPLFKGKPLDYGTVRSINPKLVYAEQHGERIVAVYRGATQPINIDGTLLPLEWEKNLIAAVHCGNQVKPGVVERIDYRTRSIVVRTPCSERINRIEIGKVKVEVK